MGKLGYYNHNGIYSALATCWAVNTLPLLAHLIPTKTLPGQYYDFYYSHFTDEEAEVSLDAATCPSPGGHLVAKQGSQLALNLS